MDGVPVELPHIEDHAPDTFFVRKILEITGHGRLVPVWEHFHHEERGNVREDRLRMAGSDAHLIDPQNIRGLEAESITLYFPLPTKRLIDLPILILSISGIGLSPNGEGGVMMNRSQRPSNSASLTLK